MDSASGLEEAIQTCLKCYRICLETMPYCLVKGGEYASPNHILLLRDCGRVCQTAAELMLTGSFLYRYTCRACAEVCRHCSESCRDLGHDSSVRRCADTCDRCAELCGMFGQEEPIS